MTVLIACSYRVCEDPHGLAWEVVERRTHHKAREEARRGAAWAVEGAVPFRGPGLILWAVHAREGY